MKSYDVDASHESPKISVVMPLYNEERYIEACLDSLLVQTYPKNQMEWILVDGASTDRTGEILESYRKEYPDLIRVADNPERTVPYAMNKGISLATGEYLIRLDAHAEYASDYFEQCVRVLQETEAQNVGGVITTKALTPTGELIADILSSPFGVGDSKFRIGGSDGYVDTVPFGAFPRKLFDEIGGYDIRLDRNEDNELNHRIHRNGGRIYLSQAIRSAYYCRSSVRELMHQASENGRWNIIAMKVVPGSMSVRHFVPLLFLVSLIILLLLTIFRLHAYAGFVLALELALYAVLALFAASQGTKSRPGDILRKFFLFPIFHLSYGWGSLKALFQIRKFQ